MYQNFNQSCIKGFSIIELMIAISINMLLITLLLEIYLTNQQSLQLELALMNIQNNAARAINILNTAVHQAGTAGCLHLSPNFSVHAYQDYSLTVENKLQGNQHEITVRYADTPASLVKTMQNKSILYSTETNINKNDILLISDCGKAEVFRAASVYKTQHGLKIIANPPLRHVYKKHAEVAKLVINRFFIANTHRYFSNGMPIYALFVEDIHKRHSELVPGIAQLTFSYTRKGKQTIGTAAQLEVRHGNIKKTWYMYAALP